jgi:Protein of unknown function (DUF4238)
MSGRKQHFMPQSLLRGFGKQGKRKVVQVTVYSSDGRVFTTATDGVAARRYFYSQLPDDVGVETLDDRITAFETRLAMSLAELRGLVPGRAVDATKAAEVVTHLCARQAHLRDSFASMAEHLVGGAAKLFLDKEWTRETLGVDALTPDDPVRDAIQELYSKFEDQLNQAGFTKTKFERLLFDKLKTEYDKIFPELSSLLQSFFAQMQGQTNRLAREAHNKALERSLVPPTRLEILERFIWRTEPGPVTGLVLPDCVAMSWTVGAGYQPLMSTGKDIDAVFMPLCHDRLLVGHRAGIAGDVPEMINELAVVSSWDCFIARDRTPEFERLIPRIGERARKLMDEAARAALEQRN